MRKKPYDLRERTFEFAVRLLEIAGRLPNRGEGRVIRDQLVRSGTSVGANVEEADGGHTIPEKRQAFVIARREAREARYWLRLIDRKWSGEFEIKADVRETGEIISILSSIISRLA